MKPGKNLAELSQRIKTPEVYDFIIKRLSDLSPLPSKGILAGQSVVSAIVEYLELTRDINPIYNDIDIFMPISRKFENFANNDLFQMFESRENSTSKAFEFEQELVQTGGYSHMEKSGIEAITGNRIIGSFSQGLLNKTILSTITQHGNAPDHLEEVSTIIKNFDINSTKAGIVLGDDMKNVFVSQELLVFLHTRQLEISNWNTPVHSLIRLVKKQKELGNIYSNINEFRDVAMVYANLIRKTKTGEVYREMETSLQASSLDQDNQEIISKIPLDFGEKFYTLFKENPIDGLKIIPSTNGKFHTLQFIGDAEKEAEKVGNSILNFDGGAFFGGNKSVMIENMSKGIIPKEEETLRAFGKGFPTLLIGKMPDVYRSLKFSKKAVKTTVAKNYSGKNGIPLFKMIPRGQRIILDLKGVDNNLWAEYMKHSDFIFGNTYHGSLLRKYFTLPFNMKEAVRKIKLIKLLESETKVCIGFLESEKKISDDEFTEENIRNLLKIYLEKEEEEMKPREISGSTEHLKFQELVTKKELKEEGKALKHCVGGYGKSIADGRSIIISISPTKKGNQKPATMEIIPMSDVFASKYRISQYHGIKNERFFLTNDIYEMLEVINETYTILPLFKHDVKGGAFSGYAKTDLEDKLVENDPVENTIPKTLMLRYYLSLFWDKTKGAKRKVKKLIPKKLTNFRIISSRDKSIIASKLRKSKPGEEITPAANDYEVDEIPF